MCCSLLGRMINSRILGVKGLNSEVIYYVIKMSSVALSKRGLWVALRKSGVKQFALSDKHAMLSLRHVVI